MTEEKKMYKKCPKCGKSLYDGNIIKLKGDSATKYNIVGKEEFCTNTKCDYERDV